VLDGIFLTFVGGVDSLDEPVDATDFLLRKTCWIQDSMPTRKKRGMAGTCTLPAGFVHNRTRTCFFRFVWSFARVCLNFLRGWPIFGDLGGILLGFYGILIGMY